MRRFLIFLVIVFFCLSSAKAQDRQDSTSQIVPDSIWDLFTDEQKEQLQRSVDSINAGLQRIWDQFNESARSIQTKSICGVEFGCSKEEAKSILYNKYGTPMYNPTNENVISYEKQKYAGVDFDNIHFLFQSDGRKSYFNACIFVLSAKSLSQAKQLQKLLAEKMEEKYRLNWIDEDTDEPQFYGGVSPLWNESYNIEETLTKFYAFRSDIMEYDKDLVKTFGYTHSVRLIYGPYQYVQEEF